MNKGSDINVGSIEEDIKILENYLKDSAYKQVDSDFFKNGGWEIVDLKIPKAIEKLLQDYTIQKQINEEHQKINGELRERIKELEEANKIFTLEGSKVRLSLYIKENYIPKQVIKDKIEELKTKRRGLGFKKYLRREDMLKEDRTIFCEIQVLQELLEGEK